MAALPHRQGVDVIGAVDRRYRELGGPEGPLGKPTTAEAPCPDGVGRFRLYEAGAIYDHPTAGTHAVLGVIWDKWRQLGGEAGPLGYPVRDETASEAGGRYSSFQSGVIIWKAGSREAFAVQGPIARKYGQVGWEFGMLGFPISDEIKAADGVGRISHFECGSIYWKPTIGAHEVHGLVRTLWADRGRERSADFGYPISDELAPVPGSADRFGDFEDGVIYLRAGASKARPLRPHATLSKSAAEILDVTSAALLPMLPDRVAGRATYTKNPPSFGGPEPPGVPATDAVLAQPVTDYRFDGLAVRNRWYKWRVGLGVEVRGSPDVLATIDLRVEVYADLARSRVVASPRQWWLHVRVPWPTSLELTANQIAAAVGPAIEPHLDTEHVVLEIPPGAAVLSAKVQRNGDLAVYTVPTR